MSFWDELALIPDILIDSMVQKGFHLIATEKAMSRTSTMIDMQSVTSSFLMRPSHQMNVSILKNGDEHEERHLARSVREEWEQYPCKWENA